MPRLQFEIPTMKITDNRTPSRGIDRRLVLPSQVFEYVNGNGKIYFATDQIFSVCLETGTVYRNDRPSSRVRILNAELIIHRNA